MGAWIEILEAVRVNAKMTVAPRVGAWIEIYDKQVKWRDVVVAPRVGAWIEISNGYDEKTPYESLPVWERG